MAAPISKSRKKKLRLQASGAWDRRLKRRAIPFVTGAERPLCRLDEQAKELDVYDQKFHCLTRPKRKSIVSTALTKQRQAA